MHRYVTALFATLVLLLAVASPVGGQGIVLIVPGPAPTPRPLPTPEPSSGIAMLELRQHQVHVDMDHHVATTRIEHVFHNPTGQRLEAPFIFPLPEGANIDTFEMDVNGETTKAELVDADKAQEIYTDIVRSMKDPALPDYNGQGDAQVPRLPHRAQQRQAAHPRIHATALQRRRPHRLHLPP